MQHTAGHLSHLLGSGWGSKFGVKRVTKQFLEVFMSPARRLQLYLCQLRANDSSNTQSRQVRPAGHGTPGHAPGDDGSCYGAAGLP